MHDADAPGDDGAKETLWRMHEQGIDAYLVWYHEHRPHQGLGARTPNEMLRRVDNLPKSGADPLKPSQVPRLHLVVTYAEGRTHLPIVTLRRAA